MSCAVPSPITVSQDTDNTRASVDLSVPVITIDSHVTQKPGQRRRKYRCEMSDTARVDSAAVVVTTVVTAADVQHRAAFLKLLRKAKQIAPTISHVWVDGYTGQAVTTAAAKAGVTVDMVSDPKPGHGFIVQPRR